MKTKNSFIVKLVAVTLMLGFFSPSISINDADTPEKLVSVTKLDISKGLLATLSTSEFTFTLFTQAEARKKKKYKKARRKARRKANRRANYRHHRHHRYDDRRRDHRRDVVGAAVVGAVVGAVINEATQD